MGENKAREVMRASGAKALREDAQDRLRRPRVESEPPDEGETVGSTAGDEEAEFMGLTDALEKPEEKAGGEESDTQRAILRAILKRLNGEATDETTTAADSPPLSIVFDRFKAERRPSEKTWREVR